MPARTAILASLALMGLGIGSAAGAAGAAPTLEMSADGEVQIATDGSVSDYRLRSQLPAAVADLIDKNVRGWRFQPVTVDGTAVVAKTAMHLGLKAESVEGKDGYRLQITEVRFGEPQRNAKIRPPHYPEQAIQAHLGAKVLLAVRLDENGQVLDAQALQTSLDAQARSEGDAERWRRMFEHASIAAAKDWRYDMTETVNGKPIGASAIVPVVFSLRELGAPPPPAGKWKVYLPGPVHPAPWMNTNPVADASSLSSLRDDEAISLDSRFHLKDDVVGKAL
jgi:hypothetical protein